MTNRQTNLAGEDVSEGGEGVVEGLIVNALVEVLDEYVTHSRLPHRWIPLRPHDPAWTPLYRVEVHCV